MFFSLAENAAASSAEDAVLVLEKWTSFHWGNDCLVWVVHYSDEVIGPWVDAEASKAGFNEAQKREYRKSFVEELRMDEAEPFLVSVYAFGAAPLELKPLGEKISLIDASGGRLKPTSYERVFDEPISGMVQGLVFFPKQPDKNFSLALRGTGVFDERIFTFQNQGDEFYDPDAGAEQETGGSDLVVIDMPPAPTAPPKTEPPTRPVVIEERTEPVVIETTVSPTAAPTVPNNENLYISRERALQNFINSWIASDTASMYNMLSEETKKMYTPETFAQEIKKAADFRRGLLSGYKLNWTGEERVKITTTKRLLIMRTLISRTLGVVRAGREWRIVW